MALSGAATHGPFTPRAVSVMDREPVVFNYSSSGNSVFLAELSESLCALGLSGFPNAGGRKHTQASCYHAGNITNNITKQVRGYDYIKLCWVAHNLHCGII